MTCAEAILDWDCEKQGCFNLKKRLKFAAFKPALLRAGVPPSISFSDIDGFFERHGYFFFIEWKGDRVPLKIGQEIAFEALTGISEKIVVFVVEGDAEFMTCGSWIPFYEGKKLPVEYGDIDAFCECIEAWAEAAEARTFNEEVITRRRQNIIERAKSTTSTT